MHERTTYGKKLTNIEQGEEPEFLSAVHINLCVEEHPYLNGPETLLNTAWRERSCEPLPSKS